MNALARAIIVVPCYNEANRLDSGAFQRFVRDNEFVHFLFVDDGSADATGHLVSGLARDHPAAFSSLILPRNVGKGEAVRAGLRIASSRTVPYIGYWDADLATPLDAIPEFIQVLDDRPHIAGVLGSRVRLLGRDINRKPVRHVLGRVFASAASLLLGYPVYDTQCGAKLFRSGPAIRAVWEIPFQTRWLFDLEILIRMGRKRSGPASSAPDLYELPLRQWTDVGGSKLTLMHFLKTPRDLFRIWLADRRQAPSDKASLDAERLHG